MNTDRLFQRNAKFLGSLELVGALDAGSAAIRGPLSAASLGVTGAGSVGGVLSVLAGSAAAPGLAFTLDPDTGIFRQAADVLSIARNGVEVARFGSTVRIGVPAGTDYLEIEADGTLRFAGAATVFRDEFGSILNARLENPSSRIQEDTTEGALKFKATATNADWALINIQLNHSWKLGSSISPHLHWWQVSANVPNWMISHRWQKMTEGQAKTTAWTSAKYSGHAFAYSSGTINQITDFGDITPPSGYGQVSDIIQFRLIRDTGNASTLFGGADPESNDIYALFFDAHAECDAVGSRSEYSK